MFFVFSVGFTIYRAIDDGHVKTYFIYLSNLNLWATMITMVLGAVMTTLFFLEKLDFQSDRKLPKAIKFYWFLWSQSLVFACMISVFYWIFLYKGEIDVANVLKHGTNSLVLIVDLCVGKHPGRVYNFLYMIVVDILYLLFTLIYQTLGGQNE